MLDQYLTFAESLIQNRLHFSAARSSATCRRALKQNLSGSSQVFKSRASSRKSESSLNKRRKNYKPAIWTSNNAFVSRAESLWFKSQNGQIEHSVATSLPPLRHFFERSYAARRCNDAEIGPVNSLYDSG